MHINFAFSKVKKKRGRRRGGKRSIGEGEREDCLKGETKRKREKTERKGGRSEIGGGRVDGSGIGDEGVGT